MGVVKKTIATDQRKRAEKVKIVSICYLERFPGEGGRYRNNFTHN